MFQPPMTFDENGEVMERMNFNMGYGTYDVINKRLINHFNVHSVLPLSQRWQPGTTRFRNWQSAPGWVFQLTLIH